MTIILDLSKRGATEGDLRAFVQALKFAALRRAGLTGIHARELLPSRIYDHLFELRQDGARCLCVMRPGVEGYDKHYWEEVPAP